MGEGVNVSKCWRSRAHCVACHHHFGSHASRTLLPAAARLPGCRWRTGSASGGGTLAGTMRRRWPGWMAAAAAAATAATSVGASWQWTRQQQQGQAALSLQAGGALCCSRRSEGSRGVDPVAHRHEGAQGRVRPPVPPPATCGTPVYTVSSLLFGSVPACISNLSSPVQCEAGGFGCKIAK